MNLSKVLIVDDNIDLAQALEVRLCANDYQTLVARDGSSAVALALDEMPFAILLDLHLPDEDGLAVMQRFRSFPELSSVQIIVVSADCSPVTQHKALEQGAHAFLEKPVNHHLLLHTLRDIQMRSTDPEHLKATTHTYPL